VTGEGPGGEARPYDPGQALISLHVPKTAGTSFRQDLEGWFGPDRLHFHYRGDQGEAPAKTELRPGLCVHGHFNRLRGIGARDYYPGARQFIVMLRDPFDRFVSTWRYLQFQIRSGVHVPDFADRPDLPEWLRRRRAVESLDDPFSFLAQLADPVDADAPAFGPEYLAVGLTERYADSVRLFADVLGKPAPVRETRVNRATDSFRGDDAAGDFSAYRGEYEAAFPLEYATYAAAEARLQRGLAAIGA
jgi:hypothetical protein